MHLGKLKALRHPRVKKPMHVAQASALKHGTHCFLSPLGRSAAEPGPGGAAVRSMKPLLIWSLEQAGFIIS